MKIKQYVSQINIKTHKKNERGIPKHEICQAIISKNGINGDKNIFRSRKNNDPDKAISILTDDIILQLNKENWPVNPGHLGENLTFKNVNYSTICMRTMLHS